MTFPKRWISVRECAEYLSFEEKTIYEKLARGEIPYSRIGRSIRIDLKALNEQLEAQRPKGGRDAI